MMEKKGSKGVTFWGHFLLWLGIIYGIINAARNIWRWDYVGLPILFVVVGIGILNLKNWARWIFLIYAVLVILIGLLGLPGFIQSINELSKEGLFLPAMVMFIMRFVIGIGGTIFFNQSLVREQFKKGGE